MEARGTKPSNIQPGGRQDERHARGQRGSLVKFAVSLLIAGVMIGAYADIGITYNGHHILPNLIAASCGGILLITHIHRITAPMIGAIAGFFLFLAAQAGLRAALHTPGSDEVLTGSIQMAYAFTTCFGLYLALASHPKRRLARTFLLLLLFLLTSAFAENYLGLRALLSPLRAAVYPGTVLYEADTRDIAMYGQVRPKFIFSEPSLFGGMAALCIYIWFSRSLLQPLMRYPALIALGLASLFLIRSPTILLALAACGFDEVRRLTAAYQQPNGFSRIQPYATAINLAGIGLLTAAFAFIASSDIDAGGKYSRSTSFFIRISGPFVATQHLLHQDTPAALLGYGLGVEDAITPEVIKAYEPHWERLRVLPKWRSDSARNLITSNLLWHWIYWGQIGGVLVLAVYAAVFKGLGARSLSYIAVVLLLNWVSIGGYVSIRSWLPAFLAAALVCAPSIAVRPRRTSARPNNQAGQQIPPRGIPPRNQRT